MTYSEFKTLFGEPLLLKLIAQNTESIVTEFITQSEAYVEAVVAQRYQLPLPTSEVVNSIIYALTCRKLWENSLSEIPPKIERAAVYAEEKLRDIQNGKLKIPNAEQVRGVPTILLHFEN